MFANFNGHDSWYFCSQVDSQQINVNIFKEAPQQKREAERLKRLWTAKCRPSQELHLSAFESFPFIFPIFVFSVGFCSSSPLPVAFSILLYMQIWHFVATAAIDSSQTLFPGLRCVFQLVSVTHSEPGSLSQLYLGLHCI